MCCIGIDANPLIRLSGGIGYYTKYLIDFLIDNGYELILFSRRSSTLLDQYEQSSNVTLVVGGGWLKSEAIWSQVYLPYLLLKNPVSTFIGITQSIPLLKFNLFKRILIIYDFSYLICPETMSLGRRYFLRLLSRFMIKSADAICSISHGTDDKLFEFYNCRSQIIVRPPIRYLSSKRSSHIPSLIKGEYFLVAASLEPRKNLDVVLRAYVSAFENRNEFKIKKLVIVGGSGWNNSHLKSMIDKVSPLLKDNLVFMNFVSDDELRSLYYHAYATILVSRYEGFGMPVAESRCLGTPTICSNIEELKEAAENNALFIGLHELENTLESVFLESEGIVPINKVEYSTNAYEFSKLLDLIQ